MRWLPAVLARDGPARSWHLLLGQNIRLHWEKPFAVIDWEHATRGDPAYDMALVTRLANDPQLSPLPAGRAVMAA